MGHYHPVHIALCIVFEVARQARVDRRVSRGAIMLNVRRFFQDHNDGFEVCAPQPLPANNKEPLAANRSSNIHLVDFSRSEMTTGDERFPRVDEILDRLDVNARVAVGAIRRAD